MNGSGVAARASGGVHVTGAFGGVIDFGHGPWTSTSTRLGGVDMFLTTLEP